MLMGNEMTAARSGQQSVRRGRDFRRYAMVLVALLALPLQSCGKHEDTAAPPAPGGTASAFKPVASIKELMDATVDPSADGVWDAVGIVSTAAGVDKHQPRTDEEWHAVRRHALTLIESMNLVAMSGRRAAPVGAKAGLGELTPEQIDAAIKANRPEFDQFAGAVQDSARDALKAIDAKDPEALVRIGGELDQRCEACHVTFWYPNSARPTS